MTAPDDAPRTDAIARFIADTSEADLPAAVRARTLVAVRDTVAAMLAATHPDIPTGRLALGFAGRQAGCPECTVVGGGAKASAVTATMVNGTLAYAADLEPSTSAALQHCLATTLPAAIAMGERTGASGARVLAAVAVGVETACRVSWALGPAAQYALGFHPSSVCGSFGAAAAAAAASVLGLGAETVSRAMGLAACQASGLMAWETDPTENSRAFQCGAAARNGVTAALLAARGFGGPSAVFDRGHTVFHAFSNAPEPERLVAGLGQDFDGVLGLKIKPYPCVAFLQPALDALLELMAEAGIGAADVKGLALRFAAPASTASTTTRCEATRPSTSWPSPSPAAAWKSLTCSSTAASSTRRSPDWPPPSPSTPTTETWKRPSPPATAPASP